jgi:hypothetical protein
MYPSDYGYATNGGTTYNRTACLETYWANWQSGSYQTDCAGRNYLWYNNITSDAPGTSGISQWLLTPSDIFGNSVFHVGEGSVYAGGVISTYMIRPTLYLKQGIVITGGTGTWNDPYTISLEDYNIAKAPKKYWFATDGEHTFPSYGGTLQSSGTATGHDVYIAQDSSKYYACATISNHEICLSQPYTQYGLSGHTINSSFTSAQQTSLKGAIYQAFIDAGISVDIDNDCSTTAYYAGCRVGDLACSVLYDGDGLVYCGDYSEYVDCDVDSTGRAFCVS